MASLEMGRSLMIVDEDKRMLYKAVALEGGSLNSDYDTGQYECEIGGAIKFLHRPQWGIGQIIPECQVITGNEAFEIAKRDCLIRMPLIDAEPLSGLTSINEEIAIQLEYFLQRCAVMAEVTKKGGEIVLPDLLGGVVHLPKDGVFHNFIVENGTGKLWFVDVYPLACLKRGKIRSDYATVLQKTGERYGDRVEEATRQLVAVIRR
jgi:hypothetical protein